MKKTDEFNVVSVDVVDFENHISLNYLLRYSKREYGRSCT